MECQKKYIPEVCNKCKFYECWLRKKSEPMTLDEAMPVDLTNAEIEIILLAMYNYSLIHKDEEKLYKKLKDILFLRTLYV